MSTIELKLPTGTFVKYQLAAQGESVAWARRPADPFSARINSTGEYDHIDIWNEWSQNDWQQGNGVIDPDSPGFSFGQMDSRVPKRLLLPPRLEVSGKRQYTGAPADCTFIPTQIAGGIEVGETGGNFQQVAVKIRTPSSVPQYKIAYWFYITDTGTLTGDYPITVRVHNDSGGVVSTQVGSLLDEVSVNAEGIPRGQWIVAALTGTSLTADTDYWVSLKPTTAGQTFSVAYYDVTDADTVDMMRYNGSSWVSVTDSNLVLMSSMHQLKSNGAQDGSHFFRLGTSLYHVCNWYIYEYNTGTESWAETADPLPANYYPTGATVWANLAFFGLGTGGVLTTFYTMNSSEVTTDSTLAGTLFAKGRYLWRATTNQITYSNDGSTWGPTGYTIDVGGGDYRITGMCEMGDNLYVSTAEALYAVYPGDIVQGVTAYGSIDDTNGNNMVHFQGAIYMTVNGRIMRLTSDHRLVDIWMTRDDDPLGSRLGKVYSLAVANNWLLAYVSSEGSGLEAASGRPLNIPTIWVYQNGSWHHLASLPPQFEPEAPTSDWWKLWSIYYDRPTTSLWCSTPTGAVFKLYMPDYALNPANDPDARFEYEAWTQWGRNWGGQIFLDKDYESVTVQFDEKEANHTRIEIYWKDAASTDWELLGTITNSEQELRWSDYTTRPAAKWIDLGMVVRTDDARYTPEIRAVVMKYLPMVRDRIQDTVTIVLAPEMQAYGPSIVDHESLWGGEGEWGQVDSMWEEMLIYIGSVSPIIYKDIFGYQYEVQIADYSIDNARLRPNTDGTSHVSEMRITLVLRQVPDDIYAG